MKIINIKPTFTPKGKLKRMEYFLSQMLIIFVFGIIGIIVEYITGVPADNVTMQLHPVIFSIQWTLGALGIYLWTILAIKRVHDLGHSGYSLITIVPWAIVCILLASFSPLFLVFLAVPGIYLQFFPSKQNSLDDSGLQNKNN